MGKDAVLAKQVLQSKNPVFYNLIPTVLKRALHRNDDVLSILLGYPHLISWNTNLRSGYIMKMSQFAELLHDAFYHQSVEFQFPSNAFRTIETKQWAALLEYQLSRGNGAGASLLLSDENVVDTLSRSQFYRILEKLDRYPLIHSRVLETLLKPHLLPRIPVEIWTRLVLRFLENRRESLASTILSNQLILQRMSVEELESVLLAIAQKLHFSQDLVSTLTHPFIVDTLSSEQWESSIRKMITKRYQVAIGLILKSRGIVGKLDDLQLRKIIHLALGHQPFALMTTLTSDPVRSRLTGKDWGNILLKLMSEHKGRLAALITEEESIMQRIEPTAFREFLQALLVVPLPSHGLIESLSDSHMLQRITSTEFTSIILSLVNKKNDRDAATLLNDRNIVQKLSSAQVYNILQRISDGPVHDLVLIRSLSNPSIIDKLTALEWTAILEKFRVNRDPEALAVLAQQDSIMTLLTDKEKLLIYKCLVENAYSVAHVSPMVLTTAAGKLVHHSFTTMSNRIRHPFSVSQSRLGGITHPGRARGAGKKPPNIRNALPVVRVSTPGMHRVSVVPRILF